MILMVIFYNGWCVYKLVLGQFFKWIFIMYSTQLQFIYIAQSFENSNEEIMHCSFKREKFTQTKINGTPKAEIIYKKIMEQNYVKQFELN